MPGILGPVLFTRRAGRVVTGCRKPGPRICLLSPNAPPMAQPRRASPNRRSPSGGAHLPTTSRSHRMASSALSGRCG